MRYVLTTHALLQAGRRGIPRETLMQVVQHPEQRFPQRQGRHIFQSRYEIEVRSPAGDLMMLIRKEHEPRRVQSDERKQYYDALRTRPGFHDREGTPASRRRLAALQAAVSTIEFPDTVPAIRDLRVATDGHLWVREYVSDLGEPDWTVFSPEGEIVARAVMAPALRAEFGEPRPQEIGSDYVLGVVVGEDDVLYVHIYAIEKP